MQIWIFLAFQQPVADTDYFTFFSGSEKQRITLG